jgi:membrane-associated protease RseP (regulator of RpoE activity)
MVEPGKFYLGNFGRVPIYVAFEAVFLLLFVSMVTPPGRYGTGMYLISLVALVATVLLHELGHAAVAIGTGMTGVTITVGAMGGYCSYVGDRRPSRVLPISLAGVTMNFVLWWLASSLLAHTSWSGGDVLANFLQWFASWNLLLGIFNSLPIYPLDGGQAVLLISQMVARREPSARRFTLSLSVAAAIAVLMYLGRDGRISTWNLILVGMLLLQAFRDLR